MAHIFRDCSFINGVCRRAGAAATVQSSCSSLRRRRLRSAIAAIAATAAMAAAVTERICRYSDVFVVARLRRDNMNWKLMLLVAALALQLVNLARSSSSVSLLVPYRR